MLKNKILASIAATLVLSTTMISAYGATSTVDNYIIIGNDVYSMKYLFKIKDMNKPEEIENIKKSLINVATESNITIDTSKSIDEIIKNKDIQSKIVYRQQNSDFHVLEGNTKVDEDELINIFQNPLNLNDIDSNNQIIHHENEDAGSIISNFDTVPRLAKINTITVDKGIGIDELESKLPEKVTIISGNNPGERTVSYWDETKLNLNQPGEYVIKGSIYGTNIHPIVKVHVNAIVTVAPEIKLKGNAIVDISAGGKYTDLGVIANDIADGDLTSKVVTTITNNVNSEKTLNVAVPATYTYHYNVTNSAGKKAIEVTRKVVVEDCVNIADFGAHSVEEAVYATFDSTTKLQDAINYAAKNKISKVDFGGVKGVYVADGVNLASNITYINTNGATLKMKSGAALWHHLLEGDAVNNVTVDGIIIDGNMQNVYGDGINGTFNLLFNNSSNIVVKNCYIHDSYSGGINLKGVNYAEFYNNKIVNTDCGICSTMDASNYLNIHDNEIYGQSYQYSEPIGIYSWSGGLAHDIVVRHNKLHDKGYANGVLIQNAEKVLVTENEIWNVWTGVTVKNEIPLKEGTQVRDITIQSNNIHDCKGGIWVAADDSKIISNTVTRTAGVGIWVDWLHSIISNNNLVSGNTIIDSNNGNTLSVPTQEPDLRISNCTDTVVESNKILDTRTPKLHYWAIQLSSANCKGNIVRNNINIDIPLSKYPIYEQNASGNIIYGNNNDGWGVLDQGKTPNYNYNGIKTTLTGGLTDINLIPDINLVDNVNLPITIDTILNNGQTGKALVVWNSVVPAFDGKKIGTYIFVGTLTPLNGTTNSKARKAIVSVTIDKPTELVVPTLVP